MSKKLAILGHEYLGKEVVELLKILGGKDADNCHCNNPKTWYEAQDCDSHLALYFSKKDIDKVCESL